MDSNNRDINILRIIVKHCNRIEDAKSRYGDSFASLESDEDYKDVAAMNILQIGELTTLLSDEFKSEHRDIPWQDIKRMRNVAAHAYHRFDLKTLWNTINTDIPALREYCKQIIANNA